MDFPVCADCGDHTFLRTYSHTILITQAIDEGLYSTSEDDRGLDLPSLWMCGNGHIADGTTSDWLSSIIHNHVEHH